MRRILFGCFVACVSMGLLVNGAHIANAGIGGLDGSAIQAQWLLWVMAAVFALMGRYVGQQDIAFHLRDAEIEMAFVSAAQDGEQGVCADFCDVGVILMDLSTNEEASMGLSCDGIERTPECGGWAGVAVSHTAKVVARHLRMAELKALINIPGMNATEQRLLGLELMRVKLS